MDLLYDIDIATAVPRSPGFLYRYYCVGTAGDAECECVDGRADGDRARPKLGSAFEFPK